MPIKYILILLCLTLCACDCPEAEYTLTADDIECHGEEDTFFYSGEACNFYSCTWYCANYKGAECAYVDLTFSSCYFEDGGDWKFDSSFIDEDGICGS